MRSREGHLGVKISRVWGPLAQFSLNNNLSCSCGLQHIVYIILNYFKLMLFLIIPAGDMMDFFGILFICNQVPHVISHNDVVCCN